MEQVTVRVQTPANWGPDQADAEVRLEVARVMAERGFSGRTNRTYFSGVLDAGGETRTWSATYGMS